MCRGLFTLLPPAGAPSSAICLHVDDTVGSGDATFDVKMKELDEVVGFGSINRQKVRSLREAVRERRQLCNHDFQGANVPPSGIVSRSQLITFNISSFLGHKIRFFHLSLVFIGIFVLWNRRFRDWCVEVLVHGKIGLSFEIRRFCRHVWYLCVKKFTSFIKQGFFPREIFLIGCTFEEAQHVVDMKAGHTIVYSCRGVPRAHSQAHLLFPKSNLNKHLGACLTPSENSFPYRTQVETSDKIEILMFILGTEEDRKAPTTWSMADVFFVVLFSRHGNHALFL